MPCEVSNNMYLQQYNDVLSHISIHVQSNVVKHCIVQWWQKESRPTDKNY